MTKPRFTPFGENQADVEIHVRYLEWDEDRKKEWIREAACLAVDAFLEDEAREMHGQTLDSLDGADRLRP
jgi:hypothetical protein